LAEDFTYYFAKSEQTPSAVSLGVLVGTDHSVIAAGGLIIQLMPGLSDQEITSIEEQLSQLPPITSLLSSGKTLEAIMAELLPSFRKMESMPVKFQCTCSKDRVEQTLISLGKEELQRIIEDGVGAEVHCHFCNELYNFGDEELQQLLIKI
jgi:molecular chaperone Hsp33